MSFYVWCEIVCETCAAVEVGTSTRSTIPRREMAREAKERGWKLIDGDWHCKQCTKLALSSPEGEAK